MMFVQTKSKAKYYITDERWEKLDSEGCGKLPEDFKLEEGEPMHLVTNEEIEGYPKILSTYKVDQIRPIISPDYEEKDGEISFTWVGEYRLCEEEAKIAQRLLGFGIELIDFKVKRSAKHKNYTATWRCKNEGRED